MGTEHTEEETPNTPESLGSGEKLIDSAVRDTAEYLVKSLGVFLLSLTSLTLTGLGWLFLGLHVTFDRLAEWLFLGAGKLHIAVKRVRWHEKSEDEESTKKDSSSV